MAKDELTFLTAPADTMVDAAASMLDEAYTVKVLSAVDAPLLVAVSNLAVARVLQDIRNEMKRQHDLRNANPVYFGD